MRNRGFTLLEVLVGVATRRCSLLTMAATDADTILKAYGQLGVENALFAFHSCL